MFINNTEISLTNKDKRTKLKKRIVEIFPFVLGKAIPSKWQNMRTCFKRELDAQKNATSGEGRRKCCKYMYFDQLLFFVSHLQDRETQSKLSTQGNEDEANSSQEEDKELSRNVRQTKRTQISYCKFCDRKKYMIQMQMKTSAFYYLYIHLSGSLTKYKSFWLGWKFSKLFDCNKIRISTHLAPWFPFQTQTVSLQTHRILQPIQ